MLCVCTRNNLIGNNLVLTSFALLSPQGERINSPVERVQSCGLNLWKMRQMAPQQKPMSSLGEWQHPRVPSSSNHPPHTCCAGLSHGTGSVSHESAPRSGNLDSGKRYRNDRPCVMTLIPRKGEKVVQEAKNSSDLPCPCFPYQSVLSHHGSCSATCGSWEAFPSAQTWHRAPALGFGYYQAAPTRNQPVRAMPFKENSFSLILEI